MKIKSVHVRPNNLAKAKLHTEDYYYKFYNDDYGFFGLIQCLKNVNYEK